MYIVGHGCTCTKIRHLEGGTSRGLEIVNRSRVEEIDMDAIDVLSESAGTFAPLLWFDAVRTLEALLLLGCYVNPVHGKGGR